MRQRTWRMEGHIECSQLGTKEREEEAKIGADGMEPQGPIFAGSERGFMPVFSFFRGKEMVFGMEPNPLFSMSFRAS